MKIRWSFTYERKETRLHNRQNLSHPKKYDELLSLAIFKPTKILGFQVEEVPRAWDEEKLKALDDKAKQLSLFQSESEVKKSSWL